MKNISYILDNIKDKKEFKNLNIHQDFKKIRINLPKKFSDYLDFMYIKNNTLFFVFNNTAIRQDFDFKKNDILKITKILKTNNIIHLDIKELKSFVTHKINKKIIEIYEDEYKEQSNGEFENHIQDEKIAKILEEIRENINAKN